jgi:hypothetical protein
MRHWRIVFSHFLQGNEKDKILQILLILSKNEIIKIESIP